MSNLTTTVSNCDQSHGNLLRDCGKYISKFSPRDKGERHSPIDFHLPMVESCPVDGNSLALLCCSHVTASGLLQGPQWETREAQAQFR